MARGESQTGTPLVSVFMPTFNGEAFVAETLDSVLGQTYEHLELIVVDDASVDATAEIVQNRAAADPRVRLVRKTSREGPCRARNDALQLARGPLLCWMDQDDLWMASKLEEQVRLMSERADVGLLYTYFDAFDSDTGRLLDWPDGRRDLEGDVLADLFAIGCFIGSITTMFRRAALGTPPRVRERDFSFGDDYDLWLTIALDWQVARIPKVLAAYRRHSDNESTRTATETNVSLRLAELLREFLDEHPDARRQLGPSARRALAWHTLLGARFEASRGRPGAAGALVGRALTLDPLSPARTRLASRPPAVHGRV